MAESTNNGIRKIKHHIKALKDVKSNRKSLLSLVISPSENISDASKRIGGWITANNEKSEKYMHAREAITFAQQILEKYSKVPDNGLIIYTGIVHTDDGMIDVAIGFEPFKLIYNTRNAILEKFDMEPLIKLLEPEYQERHSLKKDILSFVLLLVGLVAYLVARSTFKAHDA